MKVELTAAERKIQDEEAQKNRERTLVMQKENRIKVLEDKLKENNCNEGNAKKS